MRERFLPDLYIQHITELAPEVLHNRQRWGLLLDLDNTLLPNDADRFSPEVERWVQEMRTNGIRLCIVSNGSEGRTGRLADHLGVPYVARARKPLVRGLRQALRLIDLSPEQAAMAGDQLFTDVWGGNRLGLFTILVKPISPRESVLTIWKRPLERLLLHDARTRGGSRERDLHRI